MKKYGMLTKESRTLFISLAQERGHTHNEAIQVCITLAMELEAQDMGDDISDFLFFLLGLSLALICLCWASFLCVCFFLFGIQMFMHYLLKKYIY